MARQRELSLMIAVKAAPVPTAQLQESMCVPGIDLGSEPGWIRLFPIPFRDLADDSKFRKYEEVTLHGKRSDSDRRPESWVPIEGSIRTGRFFGTEHGWSARRDRIASAGEWDMCDLIARNRSGSGPETPSLLSSDSLFWVSSGHRRALSSHRFSSCRVRTDRSSLWFACRRLQVRRLG